MISSACHMCTHWVNELDGMSEGGRGEGRMREGEVMAEVYQENHTIILNRS